MNPPLSEEQEDPNEKPTFCNLCQELPEEYIALSCSHNFCLICLTKLCFLPTKSGVSRLKKTPISNENPDKITTEYEYCILCPIDNNPTSLNNSSIEALNKVKDSFIEENKRKNVYNEVIFEESAENFHTTDEFSKRKSQRNMNSPFEMKIGKNSLGSKENRNFFSNSPLNYNEKNGKNIEKNIEKKIEKNIEKSQKNEEKNIEKTIEKNIENFEFSDKNDKFSGKNDRKTQENPLYIPCSIHNTEEPILLCFTCGNKPLCIECVVNGQHKNHDIYNETRIRENCKEVLNQMNFEKKEGEFKGIIEKFYQQKRDISDKIYEIKRGISDDFAELKERLSNKENELLLEKDCEASEKFERIDAFINEFNDKIEKIREFQMNLNEKLKNSHSFSQGIELFNYFISKKQEIFEVFSEKTDISNKFNEEIVEIDKKSYVIYLENLHKIHLKTTNLNLQEIAQKVNKTREITDKIPFKIPFKIHQENHHKTMKNFESPLKKGFLLEKTQKFNENLMIKSVVKSKEIQNSSFFLTKYPNSAIKNNKENITRALQRQKEIFQRKKQGFYS